MAEKKPTKPPARVTRAVRDAEAAMSESRVLKVLLLDDAGEPVGEWSSRQMPEDPFTNVRGIQEPPYSMEQMIFLAEMHPVHSAALEQKTADVIGKGWEWEEPEVAGEDDAKANEENRERLEEWFEALCPDEEGMKEVISAAWLDYETTGWGLLELARSNDGKLRRVYHVPAHTVRAHKDGMRLVQIRQDKKVWFARWGVTQEQVEGRPNDGVGTPIAVDVKTGSLTRINEQANEIFVIRKPSRRSSWYGIPTYISAVGWITLSLAARDDNLMFFANRREPRWAIVLHNLQDDPNTQADIQRAFTVDLKQPHRNILIPIAGEGKITFQKLSDDAKDGSFDKLDERAKQAIMISHRIPPERLANSQVGPLGGNSTMAASRIYKEGVIQPAQEMLGTRLNRLIAVEYERATGETPGWDLIMDDLDVQSDQEDQQLAIDAFKADLITLREARQIIKRGPLKEAGENGEEGEENSPYNDLLYTELPGVAKGGGGEAPPSAAPPPGTEALQGGVNELLQNSRDISDRIEDLERLERSRRDDV